MECNPRVHYVKHPHLEARRGAGAAAAPGPPANRGSSTMALSAVINSTRHSWCVLPRFFVAAPPAFGQGAMLNNSW
jgi:hypothetical protein